jgi:serine/threonine protein kinase
MEPQRIGKYTILSQIGKGGMGVVYKALDPTIGRTLAIKTIRFDEDGADMAREEAQARFLREARSIGCLSHPNIVTIYEVGEDQGMSFIAMEYVEGGSLEDFLKKGKKFTRNEAIRLIIQLSEALGHAHRRDIVHRDVKPGNILIDQEGRARLVDFGIARISASTITKSNAVMGTPYYMSPEQITGQHVDGRADIFSVGAILYELLASEKPFQGDQLSTIVYKIVNEEPPPLRSYVKDLPAGLDAIVGKALAKDPDKRYQICGDLIGDLTDFLRGAAPAPPVVHRTQPNSVTEETVRVAPAERPAEESPSGSGGIGAPAASRKRGFLWGGIGLVILGLATITFLLLKTPATPKPNPAPPVPIPEPVNPTPQPVNPSPQPVDPRPQPVHPAAGASLAVSTITHDATLPNESNVFYMRFDGTMDIPPGLGRNDRVTVYFYYDDGSGTVGAAVPSNDSRFADASGNAVCGTQIYAIPSEGLHTNWITWIPYAALGLPVGQWVASGQGSVYQPRETRLLAQAVLFIDNFAIARSPLFSLIVRK